MSIELMSSGKWHNGFDAEIGEALAIAAEKCFRLNNLAPSQTDERTDIIRNLLGDIGDNFHINSPFRCDIGKNISIGNNFICNFNVTILDEAKVSIGNNVFIGPGSTICTITHALCHVQRNAGIMRALPVSIGDNVWIGANVTILPGVSIGAGTVIGADSTVTKDIPSGVLAVGSPCRIIRNITENDMVNDIAY